MIIDRNNYKINQSIPGWTYAKELYWLAMLASLVPQNGHIVEIGAWCGRSTYALLHNRSTGTKLTVVDTFDYVSPFTLEDLSLINLAGNQANAYQLASLAKKNNSWLNSFALNIGEGHSDLEIHAIPCASYEKTKKVDLVFIDGNHGGDHPLHDVEKFIDDPETLIVMDDVVPWWPSVVNAAAVARNKKMRSVILPLGTKLGLVLPSSGPMLDAVARLIVATAGTGCFLDPAPMNLN